MLLLRNSRVYPPCKGFFRWNLLCIFVGFLATAGVSGGWVAGGRVLLMQAANRVAGQEVWGERQLVDPRQDDVLGGLGHEYSEHCQDSRHPQLDCSDRCLQRCGHIFIIF